MYDTAATQALLRWREQLARCRWRGLLWIAASPDAAQARALAVWRELAGDQGLWVAAVCPAAVDETAWLPAAKARTRLGAEHRLVVIDAVSPEAGFDPEAFGALSGSVVAGGLLVLLTPADWGARPDADYVRLADHPWCPEHLSSRYLQRLARQLASDPRVAHWSHSGELDVPEQMASTPAHVVTPCEEPYATADQAQAVARLLKLKRRQPLVLFADRGRGKSAALGIACAHWLSRGERDIVVTAPRPSAVETLFRHLLNHLQRDYPQARRYAHEVSLEHAGEVRRVRFMAPDALAKAGNGAGGPGSLLLVDEAAAIPAALLSEWLKHFPRLAFATTLHGYEGSGRGFALRFLPYLKRQMPGWQAYRLVTPVRWAPGDPLEALTNQLLMLEAEPAPKGAAHGDEPLVLRRWKRSLLLDDERRLGELFGLLVQAHYRTQPSDLRRLLDGPGVAITTLEQADHIVAVSLCLEEGGFADELAERVARGERRLRGHLLAQSLAAHAGSRRALTSRVRRIMRIAVHGEMRRQGLGKRLLAAEYQRARQDGVDLLGASFGAEPELMAFWQGAGFHAVRLGLSRETSTGEHALMVVTATSDTGHCITADLVSRFQTLLPLLLAFELRELAPEVAVALFAEGQAEPLSVAQRCDLDDVALGRREPGLVRPALQQLVRRGLAAGAPHDTDAWLLVAWLFQQRDNVWLAARLGVSGRREVIARLREALARWRRWAQ